MLKRRYQISLEFTEKEIIQHIEVLKKNRLLRVTVAELLIMQSKNPQDFNNLISSFKTYIDLQEKDEDFDLEFIEYLIVEHKEKQDKKTGLTPQQKGKLANKFISQTITETSSDKDIRNALRMLHNKEFEEKIIDPIDSIEPKNDEKTINEIKEIENRLNSLIETLNQKGVLKSKVREDDTSKDTNTINENKSALNQATGPVNEVKKESIGTLGNIDDIGDTETIVSDETNQQEEFISPGVSLEDTLKEKGSIDTIETIGVNNEPESKEVEDDLDELSSFFNTDFLKSKRKEKEEKENVFDNKNDFEKENVIEEENKDENVQEFEDMEKSSDEENLNEKDELNKEDEDLDDFYDTFDSLFDL